MWASGVTYVDPSKFVLPQCLRGVGRFPGVILASKNTKGRLNHFHFHLRRERGAKRSRETRIGRGGQKETHLFSLSLFSLSPLSPLSLSPLALLPLALLSLSLSLFLSFSTLVFFSQAPHALSASAIARGLVTHYVRFETHQCVPPTRKRQDCRCRGRRFCCCCSSCFLRRRS